VTERELRPSPLRRVPGRARPACGASAVTARPSAAARGDRRAARPTRGRRGVAVPPARSGSSASTQGVTIERADKLQGEASDCSDPGNPLHVAERARASARSRPGCSAARTTTWDGHAALVRRRHSAALCSSGRGPLVYKPSGRQDSHARHRQRPPASSLSGATISLHGAERTSSTSASAPRDVREHGPLTLRWRALTCGGHADCALVPVSGVRPSPLLRDAPEQSRAMPGPQRGRRARIPRGEIRPPFRICVHGNTKERMSAATLTHRTESERIGRWRVEELERAGYDPTRRRAREPGYVDLHSRSSLSSAVAPEPSRFCCRQREKQHRRIFARRHSPDPVALERRRRSRPAAHPPGRVDAALASPRDLAHGVRRTRLGGTGTSSSASRLGGRVRDRRRPHLPRHHELERGSGQVVGTLRGLAGWARRLGRDPVRLHRGRDRHPPIGAERSALRRRRRPRPAGRAGDRPPRQLVQPGAVRQAHEPPLGAEDRPGAPAAAVRALGHVPPDLPLRADLRPRHGRSADRDREPVPDPAARAVRALRVLLHVRAHARGAAAGRPSHHFPASA
jgi:hypothetical protein